MSRIAFILGSGARIGESVASLLKSKGYQVAVGSRNPNFEVEKQNGYLPVQFDASNSGSIIDAFALVNKELGPPNVVIYNAAAFSAPEDPTDPLSLPLEQFNSVAAIGLGLYTAAQQALPGFRATKGQDIPHSFIATGNILPLVPPKDPKWLSLDILKTVEARLVDLFSRAYLKEEISFYFPVYTTADGTGIPPWPKFVASGPLHAKVFWELINQKPSGEWEHRFADEGKKLPNVRSD